MGLAPYGDPERFLPKMRELVKLDGDGFELELDYFVHHKEGVDMTWDEQTPTIGRLFSDRMEDAFGPAREPRSELTKDHEDVAAALQAMLEEGYLHLVRAAHRRTGSKNLCLAGGVALNAVANGRIRPRPSSRASTSSRGRRLRDRGRRRVLRLEPGARQPARLRDGARVHRPAVRRRRGRERDPRCGLRAEAHGRRAALRPRRRAHRRGDVVGWFQGRMEFGPRALGNRSIVVDPRRHDMKDILNARIKHREHFRPFAPSILAETAGDWFEQDYTSPFMVLVYKTRPDKRDEIPAVNHVDDTGRLQTVEERVRPALLRLIKAFADRTGVPSSSTPRSTRTSRS
jgi:carbamoyltransferase